MNLTRANYEIWFLDYSEGKLNPAQIEAIHRFVMDNADLAGELDAFTPVLSADPLLSYPDKEGLKKALYEDVEYLENTMVASLEGDLNRLEQELLEKWMAEKPEAKKMLDYFGNVQLKPDRTIHFPRKAQLKRKVSLHPDWWWITSVAALLLLVLFVFQPGNRRMRPGQVAQLADVVAKQEHKAMDISVATHKQSGSDAVKRIYTEKPADVSKRPARRLTIKTQQPIERGIRPSEAVALLKPRITEVKSDFLLFADLAPIREHPAGESVSGEISVADYLKKKYEALKADEPKLIITREEIVLAGLHLFSRLPGRHLTGRKGADGTLKSISFNSQLLAFSIPLNR